MELPSAPNINVMSRWRSVRGSLVGGAGNNLVRYVNG